MTEKHIVLGDTSLVLGDTSLVLGDTHKQNESLNIEFKEFCLNIDPDVLYDTLDVKKLCIDGIVEDKDEFNNIVLKTIQYYIYKYIPRYTSAFLNSNVNNAELVFGVDDFSEITGVPFIGTKEELENCISKINITKYLKKHVKTVKVVRTNETTRSTNSSKEIHVDIPIDVSVSVKVECLILDQNFLTDDSMDIFNEFYNNLEIKKQQSVKYKKNRIKWADALNEYTCKLPDLIHNKSKEFELYLKEHAPQMLGYTIHQNEMRNIAHLKIDPDHYIYWLMQFKDTNIARIKSEKPLKPIPPKVIHGPDYLITNLTHMRSKFIKANSQLNYFLITIKFPKDTSNYPPIYYFNTDNEKWMKKTRKHHQDTGPCCISL
jgi:hypothetical protein